MSALWLVTGGAGFIGAATAHALLARGARVRVLDDLSTGRADRLPSSVELITGSILDAPTVDLAMRSVERVIHLAARVSVPASWDDPTAFVRTNVEGHQNVLAAAALHGVRRVVYASSCAVYGSLPGLPKREDAPLAPESPYAASKAANEAFASAWSRSRGVPTVGLRYFNVFGPGQDPAGPYGAVIPRFVTAALRGEPLTVFGDGTQGRDFIAVADVAAANIAAGEAPIEEAHVLNIGTGTMLTLLQLADALRASLRRPVTLRHEPPRAGDVRFSRADVTLARQTLGWAPSHDFAAALHDTLLSFHPSMEAR